MLDIPQISKIFFQAHTGIQRSDIVVTVEQQCLAFLGKKAVFVDTAFSVACDQRG